MDDVSDISDDGPLNGHRMTTLTSDGQSSGRPDANSAFKPFVPTANTYVAIDEVDAASKSAADTVIRGWPQHPRRIKRYKGWGLLAVAVDVLTTLLPVFFLFIAIAALSLDTKPRSNFGDNVIEATKYGTTAFPIVFAVVVAKFLRTFALWKCEKGATIGKTTADGKKLLEQMIGSQSLGSTIERFYALRRYNFISLTIVLLWMLSPFGSQMTLRLLKLNDSKAVSHGTFNYFNTTTYGGAKDVGSSFESASGLSSDRASLMAQVIADVMSAPDVLRSSVDQWNNVKIPQFSSMTTAVTGENDWVDIQDDSNITWASLSGIMTTDLPASGETDFDIEASFMNVSCPDSIRIPTSNFKQHLDKLGLKLQFSDGSLPRSNNGDPLFLDSTSGRALTSDGPLSLVYGSMMVNTDETGLVSGNGSVDLYNCTFTTPRILAQVTCGSSCKVTRVRNIDSNQAPSKAPPFGPVAFANLLLTTPGMLGSPHPGYMSPVDNFMMGSDSPLLLTRPFRTDGYANIPGPTFARRLTTLINTVWQASLCPYGIALGSAAGNMSTCTLAKTNDPVAKASFTNERALHHSNYATNRWHAIALLAISTLLQLAAFATLIIAALTNVPDILGWVSTITRDNGNLVRQGVVPEGGSWMSGAERAKLLGDLRVKLTDVNAGQDQEFGRIAFVGIKDGAGATLAEKVRRDNIYV